MVDKFDVSKPMAFVFNSAVEGLASNAGNEVPEEMKSMLHDFFMYGVIAALNTLQEGLNFPDGTTESYSASELISEADESSDEDYFNGLEPEDEEDDG